MASSEKPGVYLKWEGVCYDVDDKHSDVKGSQKRILHDVFGFAAPGEMLAIMGPSGCGKSSLLNALAQRRKSEDGITGTIQINGASVPSNFNRLSGYVTQDFVFFEHLTVWETLEIAAMLRLPRSNTKAQKIARAELLLKELDLWNARDTPVGAPVVAGHEGGGISGGERRRLCIAMELMNDPHLLFLDEPTSGLDAASALMVVEVLERLAKEGKTIVCVIHQPRASILPKFHHVLLLGGGKQVYYGPSCKFNAIVDGKQETLKTDALRDFFSKNGIEIPTFENPADTILDAINTVADDAPADASASEKDPALMVKPTSKREATVARLCADYSSSDLKRQMEELACRGQGAVLPEISGSANSKYANSWCTQFWVLLGRTVKLKARDPMALGTIVSSVIILGVLFGSIYFQIEDGEFRERSAAISMFVTFMAFMCFDILLLWPAEKSVYLRDQRAGMYTTSAFYIGRSVAELPTHAISGIIGGVICYFMFGLDLEFSKLLMFALLSGLTIVTSGGLFMAVSSAAKNFEQSNMLVMPILTIFMLFCGFFISRDATPAFWRWVPHVNYLYYTINYLVIEEVKSMEYCSVPATSCSINGTVIEVITRGDCDELLTMAGFDQDLGLWATLLCHIITNVICRVLAYLGLRFCWTGQTCSQRCRDE